MKFNTTCYVIVQCRREDHTSFHSLARNRVSNLSFTVSSAGEIVILAVMVGILKAVKSENNTKAFSILIAFSGGVWCMNSVITSVLILTLSAVLCALPWFFLEQRRPGLNRPPGTNFWAIGFTQAFVALRECMRLKQTFLYLIFYFLM
jgi:hypothetical protein